MNEAKEQTPGGAALRDPAVELGTKLYKNLNMSADAVLHLLPKVTDERIKSAMSSSLVFYEKTAGKVREELGEHCVDAPEENLWTKMMARMGITMNTLMDATDSHIAQMVIEGSTMSVTESAKLRSEYRGKPGCDALLALCDTVEGFEKKYIDNIKQYL